MYVFVCVFTYLQVCIWPGYENGCLLGQIVRKNIEFTDGHCATRNTVTLCLIPYL